MHRLPRRLPIGDTADYQSALPQRREYPEKEFNRKEYKELKDQSRES
jgi:hypothetical protein